MIYSGDEIRQVNDYTYKRRKKKKRTPGISTEGTFKWDLAQNRDDQNTESRDKSSRPSPTWKQRAQEDILRWKQKSPPGDTETRKSSESSGNTTEKSLTRAFSTQQL